MKSKLFYLLFTIILLSVTTQAQERDSLIHLYEGIGDTIYSFEREYLRLFPQIKGFEYATFYIRNDDELVSRITFQTDNELKDTIFIQDMAVLDKLRLDIKKFDTENRKKRDSPKNVIVYTKEEKQYAGLLEMFSKKDLYLLSIEQNNYRFKIPLVDVEKIVIPAESKVLSSIGWGALVGVVVGALIGFASGDDEGDMIEFSAGQKALGAGAALGLLGALVGLFVGLGASEDEHQIEFNDESDIIKLMDIAYYNFIYNKSLESVYDNIN
jgi:hypothetical protein